MNKLNPQGLASDKTDVYTQLVASCIGTLTALIEQGPLWDGDVPSKRERDLLVGLGLAVRVVSKLEDGFTAATYAGRDSYKVHYYGDSMVQAKANRIQQRALL